MKLSSQIKPVSYLKAHAAEIVRTLVDQREPLISLGASTPRQASSERPHNTINVPGNESVSGWRMNRDRRGRSGEPSTTL